MYTEKKVARRGRRDRRRKKIEEVKRPVGFSSSFFLFFLGTIKDDETRGKFGISTWILCSCSSSSISLWGRERERKRKKGM